MGTETQGRLGEAAVASEFIRQGWDVFTPAFGNPSCDMVIVKGLEVKRVEVKTTRRRLKSGNYDVFLTTNRRNGHTKFNGWNSDILAVYVEPTGRIHLLDSKDYDDRRSVVVEG